MEKKYLNDSGLMHFWGRIKSYTKSVSDDLKGQINDKQQQITANDEDISLLQTRSTQMEETIKSIAATGGASQATSVTYDNANSQLTAVNIQSAVDELQGSKIDKTSILQESGDSEDKVMSQKAVSDNLSDLTLKSAILNSQKVSVSVGKNLFNKNNSDNIIGYYFGSLGGLIKNDGFIITHPIKVPVGKSVVSASAYDQNVYNNIYNSDGKLLETVLGHKYTNNHSEDVYIRFTCNALSWNTIQVEEGTSATSYEEYTEHKDIDTTIADLRVDIEKDYIKKSLSKNLFNKNSNGNRIGYALHANGTLVKQDNTVLMVTHEIAIDPSKKYYCNNAITENVYSAIYDANHKFISSFQTKALDCSEYPNARFVRFCLYTSTIDTTQVEEGTSATSYEEYTEHKDIDTTIADLRVDIEKDYIKKSLSKNLFNKNSNGNRIGYALHANGTLVKQDNTVLMVTHEIAIDPSKKYYCNNAITENVYSAIYDANHKFISSFQTKALDCSEYPNARFVRFCLYTSTIDTTQVEEGTSATSYEEYTENREIKEQLDALKVSLNDTFNDLSLKNAILNSQKVSVSVGKNLFNKNNSDNIIGYYFGSLGGLIKNDGFIITHPIKVPVGKSVVSASAYDQNVYNNIYNSDGKLLETVLGHKYTNNHSEDVYIRFTCNALSWNTIQVEEGTSATSYEEYTDKLDLKSEIEKNFIKKSLGKNLFNKNSSDNLIGYTYHSDGALVKLDDNILMLTHEIDIDCLQYYCNNAITETVYSAVFDKKHNLLFTFQSKTLDCRNVPQARYVRFALYTSTIDTTQVEEGTSATSYEEYTEFKGYGLGSTSNKPKKNILWLGTSIPNGSLSYKINYNGVELNNNYPQIVGHILGCNVNNKALGSSRLRVGNKKNVTEDNPLGWTQGAWWEGDVMPLMSTRAEKEDIVNNWSKYYAKYNWQGAPETLSDFYKTLILSSTYEYRVLNFLNGSNPPDIIVIDHGHNDGVPVNSEGNFEEDINSTDRFTFFGAYNMLINTIRKYNSRIKIVQISHFISKHRDNEPNYTNLVKGQKAIADKNGVIFCPLYEIDGWDAEGYIKTYGKWMYDTGSHSSEKWATWKDNTLAEAIDISPTILHCPDTIHPHSDMSGQSNIQLAEALAAWFSGNVF